MVRARAISPDEAREWLLKNLAALPERDEAWYARVLNICTPPQRGPQPASFVSHGDT